MSVKGYYLFKVESCPRCGFSGKVNDYEQARRVGLSQVIVECPECKGAGEKTTEIGLLDALNELAKTNLFFSPFPGIGRFEDVQSSHRTEEV